jgi:hypothetical protein
MQPEVLSRPAAILEIAKYFIPAAITAFTSIMINRYQWKAKEIEIRGQAELKAREILFNSYQKRIERITNFGKDLGEALGKLMPEIKEIAVEERLTNALVEMVKLCIAPYRAFIEELEDELSKANLSDKKLPEVSLIKETLAIQPEHITTENIGSVYLNLMKTLGLIHSLREDLLDDPINKC